MAKNFNYKKLKAVSDSRKQRVSDMRSGGSGSLRSSLFNRTDEALPDETIEAFRKEFWNIVDGNGYLKVGGGNLKGGNGKKHVCGVKLTLPDKVGIGGNVDALLAKVDYDKNTRTFVAYYRPKNGKWGQSKNVDEEF